MAGDEDGLDLVESRLHGLGRFYGSQRAFFLAGLAFAAGAYQQAAAQQATVSPACTKGDLEIHFGFSESPTNFYNLEVQGQNTSSHACSFEDSLFDPRFTGGTPPFRCEDCAKREREGFRDDGVATGSPMVRPGEVVRRQYRWRMRPEVGSDVACFRPQGMDSEYSFTWTLATPSLMRDVCSNISVVGMDVLAARDAGEAEKLWTNEAYDALNLSATRKAFYLGEVFPLTISDRYPPHGAVDCPAIYLWDRSADGTVQVEERKGKPAEGCRQEVNLRPNQVFSSSEWKTPEAKRLSNYDDHEVRAFEAVSRGEDRHTHFLASEVLHLRVVDSSDQSLRKWTRLDGLAADVLLDRGSYKAGEDIPLHLAIANFAAMVPVYSWDPAWDPCSAVGIQVLDEQGRPLPESSRSHDYAQICSGHGFGPRLFEVGKIASLEWTLQSTGWLPKLPGKYTIVLTWCTSTGKVAQPKNGGWTADLKPYATVQARAAVEIVAADGKAGSR